MNYNLQRFKMIIIGFTEQVLLALGSVVSEADQIYRCEDMSDLSVQEVEQEKG